MIQTESLAAATNTSKREYLKTVQASYRGKHGAKGKKGCKLNYSGDYSQNNLYI